MAPEGPSRLAKAAGAEPAGQMRHKKVHAVVARITFPSQYKQNTPWSDLFWLLRCWKKWTPLWREAHFGVKMYKTPQPQTPFGSWDVERVHPVVARSAFPNLNDKKLGSDPFLRFRCRKSVEKVHAVVARTTFRSQKGKKWSFWAFLTYRCQKKGLIKLIKLIKLTN